jgi:hypothetical protein
MLSVSMAMSIYTGPRYTRDFEFVVHLKPSDITHLSDHFKEGYYCDEDSVVEAIRQKTMFNIIDHKSNYKADFMIVKDNEFEKTKFERRLLVPFLDYKIYVVSKEDLLLSKLTWIQLLQSSVQTVDILNRSELK